MKGTEKTWRVFSCSALFYSPQNINEINREQIALTAFSPALNKKSTLTSGTLNSSSIAQISPRALVVNKSGNLRKQIHILSINFRPNLDPKFSHRLRLK